MKLTILRGISGSGKTTWAGEQDYDWYASADQFFETEDGYEFDPTELKLAHAWCFSRVAHGMALGMKWIILDNTNTRRWEYESYVKLAAIFGYEVEIKIFNIDPEQAHARNVHNVPLETIKAQYERFEK